MSREICISDRDEGGFRVSAPAVPGCVVVHYDPAHATDLVRTAIMALRMEAEESIESARRAAWRDLRPPSTRRTP